MRSALLADKHHLPVVSMLSGWSYGHEGLCLSSPDPLVRGERWEDWVITSSRPPGWGLLLVVGLLQGSAPTRRTRPK